VVSFPPCPPSSEIPTKMGTIGEIRCQVGTASYRVKIGNNFREIWEEKT